MIILWSDEAFFSIVNDQYTFIQMSFDNLFRYYYGLCIRIYAILYSFYSTIHLRKYIEIFNIYFSKSKNAYFVINYC